MNKAVQKNIISKNLENWYAIDSILFNNHARNVIKEGKVFSEYCSLKASLLSNVYEYWNRVEYTPVDTTTHSTVRQLQESAVTSARKGKKLAADLISKDSVKNKIKNHIVTEAKKRNIKDIEKFQDTIIHEKFLQISIDNCLIGLPLLESKNPDVKCDFNCKILEDSHKLLRDNLVRLAMVCEKVDNEKEEPKKKGSKIKTAAKIAGGAVGGALAYDAYRTAQRWKDPTKKGAGIVGRVVSKPFRMAYNFAQGGKKAADLRNQAAEAMKNANTPEAKEAAKKLKSQADQLKRFKHVRGAGKAAVVGGLAVGGYMLFKKLLNSGKKESEAAQQAANSTTNPQEKARLLARAAKARKMGK